MSDGVAIASGAELRAGDPRREIRTGVAVASGFFLLFLGWAAFVPLDAGVSAPGVIAVSGNRQAVQQKDGGVVTAIHVREGQHVTKGEVLIELSAPELRAAERALTSDYLLALAQRSRLLAERTGQRELHAVAIAWEDVSGAQRVAAACALHQLLHVRALHHGPGRLAIGSAIVNRAGPAEKGPPQQAAERTMAGDRR